MKPGQVRQFTWTVPMTAVGNSARMCHVAFISDMAMLMSVPFGEVVVMQTGARSYR